MMRVAAKSVLHRASILNARQRIQSVRHQSSSSGGGGGGKLLLTATLGIGALAGGTIGYASIDNEFRKMVQDSVPGSKEAFDAILGEETKAPAPSKPVTSVPPSKLKITSTPPMPEIEKPIVAKKPEIVKEVAPKPEVVVKKAEEKPKQAPKTENDVQKIQMALDEACKEMDMKVRKAVESGKVTIDAIKDHMTLVRGVMEDPKDEKRAWNEVFEAATKKSDSQKELDKLLKEAKDSLNKTIDVIEKGRKNPATQDSSVLKAADEKASSALNDLTKVYSSIDSVQKEAKLIEDYRGLVEEGRQQFQKEIEAILPGTNLSQKSEGLTEEELNIFMTHAYRKVCQLQDELAKAQTFNRRSSSSSESSSDVDVQSELDAQRRELEVEHHRKLGALREEMEKEMRTQLRRQAAAHADHINDVLDVQAKELKRLHERDVDEALNNERSDHKRDLAAVKGSLEGLNKALEDKNFMSNATFDSQQFWLACVALQKVVEGGADKATIEAKIKAIEASVKDSVAFQNDDLVQVLLKSIPSDAKKEGVEPCGEIKQRFNKVEEMARKTALVGEEGGSLALYALSYLQSLLVISPSNSVNPPAKGDKVIDVDTLNTFDIVWLAKKALEVDDLEQAIRYMNLLKGEPRRQAADWLKSARLHLEMQQVSQALASYATAVGAEAVPGARSSS